MAEDKEEQAAAPPGLSSGEVNFLIYRYLLESGFGHAAFAFASESEVNKLDVSGRDVRLRGDSGSIAPFSDSHACSKPLAYFSPQFLRSHSLTFSPQVPVGALVSFIQKGFQLVELEANLNSAGTDVYGKYVQFSANDILTKDLSELKRIAEEIQGEGDDKDGIGSPQGKKKVKKGKKAGKPEVSVLDGSNVVVTDSALPPLEIQGLDGQLENGDRVHVDDVDKQEVEVKGEEGQEGEEDGKEGDAEDEASPGPPPPPPPEEMDVDEALWETKREMNGATGPDDDGEIPPPPLAIDDNDMTT